MTSQSGDIQLNWQDRDAFRRELARVFPGPAQAQYVTSSVVPPVHMPAWSSEMSAEDWWTEVFHQLDAGGAADPYRVLLREAVKRYAYNRVFRDLYEEYLGPSSPVPAEASAGGGACHVIVRADDEEGRLHAAETLTRLELRPVEVWSTGRAVSYSVAAGDATALSEALAGTDLGWTVVPPGQPDYLLRELNVQGPDGRRFRIIDAPATQTVSAIARELLTEYGPRGVAASEPAQVNLLGPDGERTRLDPDATLHDIPIRDGDNLIVAYQALAGAIHPAVRVEGLRAAAQEIATFVAGEPGVVARAGGGGEPPSAWELDFERPGFGPPGPDTREPVPILRHTVRIELGADHPAGAPLVYWITPIFHPNVFPNYACGRHRQAPHLGGLVCLGAANGLTEVCRLILDIAAYHNFCADVLTGPDGQPWGDFYDDSAAAWAARHLDLIKRRGGRPAVRLVPRQAGEVGLAVELVDE